MIEDGFLGALRELHVTGMNADLADPLAPIGWRQRARYSGFNMLTLGILHETAARWTAPATRVWAWALKTIPERFEPESGERVRVGTPDSVQVVTTQADGSRGLYRLSGVTWHAPGLWIEMYGSHGTIRYDLSKDRILAARRDESELRELAVPEEIRGRWRVEEEFVAAIRGEEHVRRSTFADGVGYMQFTEAVARSSRHQIPVDLPLTEFSHPGI
jgi:predicted dehydrogenase